MEMSSVSKMHTPRGPSAQSRAGEVKIHRHNGGKFAAQILIERRYHAQEFRGREFRASGEYELERRKSCAGSILQTASLVLPARSVVPRAWRHEKSPTSVLLHLEKMSRGLGRR